MSTDVEALRHRFEAVAPFTVGVEEEVLLLHPGDLQPAPVVHELLSRMEDEGRFKAELPACQVEITTGAHARAADAVAELAAARRRLAGACAGLATPVATPVHPFAPPEAELTRAPRYAEIERRYASVGRRQLVSSLQVHVAVGGAERTLGVFNALRPLLPELAALAANAPFLENRDTGLASVRPAIAAQLPRQGIPPPIESWEAFARELDWGSRSDSLPDFSLWWWELRPHPRYGTLELRVPDVQTTIAEAAGVIGLAQALVATLAERHDAGEPTPSVPTWRIEENRWAAMRHGLAGSLADVQTGALCPARKRLSELVDWVQPTAERLGGGAPQLLDHARALIEQNGAERLRDQRDRTEIRGALTWMADRFLLGV